MYEVLRGANTYTCTPDRLKNVLCRFMKLDERGEVMSACERTCYGAKLCASHEWLDRL